MAKSLELEALSLLRVNSEAAISLEFGSNFLKRVSSEVLKCLLMAAIVQELLREAGSGVPKE